MIRRIFLPGLVIFLPLCITYIIFSFLVNVITNPFHDIVHSLLIDFGMANNGLWGFTQAEVNTIISRALIIISLGLLLVLIGAISHRFAVKLFLYINDLVIGKLPIIGSIYSASKDFTHALFSPKSETFTQVVLVPYPSPIHRAIGLVTATLENDFLPSSSKKMISVLIPGTPNPTNGYVLLYPQEEVIYLNMSAKEALRFIMSCGTSQQYKSGLLQIDIK